MVIILWLRTFTLGEKCAWVTLHDQCSYLNRTPKAYPNIRNSVGHESQAKSFKFIVQDPRVANYMLVHTEATGKHPKIEGMGNSQRP